MVASISGVMPGASRISVRPALGMRRLTFSPRPKSQATSGQASSDVDAAITDVMP